MIGTGSLRTIGGRRRAVIDDLVAPKPSDSCLGRIDTCRLEGLTEQAARELAEEAVALVRRGRPAVDPDAGPGERSPRVTFRVPAQTRRRLEERAREQGRPVADVLREAVEQYLR